LRKALIIGIDDYPKAPLKGCIKDAISIYNVLEKNSDGSPNFHAKLLTDSPETLTRANLRKDIEQLFHGKCDVALLYFSGHGIIKATGGYIVARDFEKYDEGISMDEILKLANKSEATDKVIILDCCNSGSFGSSVGDSTIAQLGDGLTVLTACRENEAALLKDGSSIFTSLLIDALQGGAADLRGNITPGHLYAYVDEALGAWDQRPIFRTNISKFISLRQITPRVPKETLRKLTLYFKNPEELYPLNPTYEDTQKEISIPENVAIMKDLQKFQSVGLVVPVDAEFMYFAAMESKSCRLTAIGYQYWRLVHENKLT
jgi:hypothetical protein